MDLFCNGCEYLSDNPDLRESCIHRKFCEQAYRKGLVDSSAFCNVTTIEDNSNVLFFMNFDTFRNRVTFNEIKSICNMVSNNLENCNCLYLPDCFTTIHREKFTMLTLRNKFHYKENEWLLTSEEGDIFSNEVKAGLEELTKQPINAYNEVRVAIVQLNDDYRNLEFPTNLELSEEDV